MNKDRRLRGKDMTSQQDQPVGNLESTQMRNGQKTGSGTGDVIDAGRPDMGGSRSEGVGQVSHQSGRHGSGTQSRDVATDGGAPSAQTSGAKDEVGQL